MIQAHVDDRLVQLRLGNLITVFGKRVVSRALRRGLTEGLRCIRAAIASWPASRAARAAARRSIGVRVSLSEREPVAKLGFGVGRRTKPARPSNRPGVGISRANIHWLVLGTSDRYTNAGAYRGACPAIFRGLTQQNAVQILRAVEREFVKYLRSEIDRVKRVRR